ncbi:hypothetical protein Tco_1112649 [Tanacetum coccineum]|uniref:Uncharacterized protein n=1 Tax=Tanacetum coccineum TaxID=301880 RepID=A0ABQ5IQG7_9ASTR
MSIHSSSHLRGQLGDHPRKHRNGADIENMTMSEYLEYEAVKERIVWDDVQSRRSPTHYDEGILALFTGIRDSICKQDVDLEKDREEDGDDGDIFYMWDITVEDVERVKQFLTPNVPDVMDNIIQPLIPKTIHTTPPDEDYVAPATKSILEYLFEEFRDEISNVTMIDEGAECSLTKDLEELERLLAKDPLSHYTEIRVHSVIINPDPFIYTQLMSPLYGMFKTSKPCKVDRDIISPGRYDFYSSFPYPVAYLHPNGVYCYFHPHLIPREWSDGNLRSILNILKCFFLASGLQINIHKSQGLGVGVPRHVVDQATSSIDRISLSGRWFVSQDGSLWFRVIGALYGSSIGSHPTHMSSNWCSIVRELHLLKDKGFDFRSHCKKRVGNGNDTRFWLDRWIGDKPLSVNFPRLFALELNKDVSVAVKMDTSVYHSFRRSVRDGLEQQLMVDLYTVLEAVSLSNSQDRWICDLAQLVLRRICRWWDLDWQFWTSFPEWQSWFSSIRLSSKVKNMLEGVFCVAWLANFNLEDDNDAAFLVLLSNVYARAKSWKDVANVREKMIQLALKKLPGRSWAQINGSVHEL